MRGFSRFSHNKTVKSSTESVNSIIALSTDSVNRKSKKIFGLGALEDRGLTFCLVRPVIFKSYQYFDTHRGWRKSSRKPASLTPAGNDKKSPALRVRQQKSGAASGFTPKPRRLHLCIKGQ
jgi:hypothetical protein